jgi:hypothetical protein
LKRPVTSWGSGVVSCRFNNDDNILGSAIAAAIDDGLEVTVWAANNGEGVVEAIEVNMGFET